MDQEYNRSSIQRQLDAKEQQIKDRIDVLEDELVSMPAAIKSAIMKNPLLGVGAAIAAGVLVGLVFTRRKKKATAVAPAHQALVEGYIAALATEVRKAVRRGKDPEEAVRKSLRGRTPVIIYAPNAESPDRVQSRGALRDVGDLVLKTALGFAVKEAIDMITAGLNVKGLQKMLALEREEDDTVRADAPHPPAGDGAPESSPLESERLDH
jgi:hypothetical protein